MCRGGVSKPANITRRLVVRDRGGVLLFRRCVSASSFARPLWRLRRSQSSQLPAEQQNKPVQAEVIEVTPYLSFHQEGLLEAGKKMLTDSLSIGLDFCKTMIGTSTMFLCSPAQARVTRSSVG